MSDFLLSLVRTYVPIAVGGVAAWLITLGIVIDPEIQAAGVIFFTGVITALYYFAARLLELKWPTFGLLLGARKAPAYSDGE